MLLLFSKSGCSEHTLYPLAVYCGHAAFEDGVSGRTTAGRQDSVSTWSAGRRQHMVNIQRRRIFSYCRHSVAGVRVGAYALESP